MEEKSVPEILQEVKEMDIVTYLSSLGIEPAKRPVNDSYVYLSPLRDESEASFKVDRGLNSWFDHGEGIGGNLVDLMLKLHDWTIGDVLRWRRNNSMIVLAEKRPGFVRKEPEAKIEIVDVRAIAAKSLLNYLRQRRIDLEVADRFCKEITYKINDNILYGIGMKNDGGGWAIRTPFLKSASYPNESTSIKNGSQIVVPLEGQFEYLSYQTIFKNKPEASYDFQILNSVNNIATTLPKMAGYQHGLVMMNNDKAGQNATDVILKQYPHFKDERSMFANHKDLNDWHCHWGLRNIQTQKTDQRKISPRL